MRSAFGGLASPCRTEAPDESRGQVNFWPDGVPLSHQCNAGKLGQIKAEPWLYAGCAPKAAAGGAVLVRTLNISN